MLRNKPARIYIPLFILTMYSHSPQARAEGKNVVLIYAGVSQPSLSLTVNDEGSVDDKEMAHEILYEPRLPTIGLIGFSYAGIGFSVSQDIEGSQSTSSEYTDYSLSLAASWIGLSLAYTEFLHFQIAESSGFAEVLGTNETSKEDLAMRFYSADMYIFPIRWSYDFSSAFDPSKEKTNGIGIGLVASGNRTAMDTRSGLLPEPWQAAFGSDGGFTRGELNGVGVEATIAGTLRFGPLYLSALIAEGMGTHSYSYQTSAGDRTGSGNQALIRGRADLGLLGKNLFCALRFKSQSPAYELKYMTMSSERSEIGFVSGFKW